MMIKRRQFLVGLGALFASPAVCRASVLMPLRGEIMLPSMTIPPWCPPGWAPANGHLVDRFQFPELHAWFKRTRQHDAIKGGQFRLPDSTRANNFKALRDYEAYRLSPEGFETPPINWPSSVDLGLPEVVEVPLIAVKPMVRPNGTVAQPGMMANYVVNAQALMADRTEYGLTPYKKAVRQQFQFVRKATDQVDLLPLEGGCDG